jgi:hypothetical protein
MQNEKTKKHKKNTRGFNNNNNKLSAQCWLLFSLSLFLPGVSRMRKHTRARTLLVCSSCWEGMEEEEEEEKDFSSFLLKEEKR